MAKQPDHPILLSMLDRLIDEEPEKDREGPKSRAQELRELKQAVRRDLENLLNTRWCCQSWPPKLEELDSSLLNYGIPDFTGANMGSADEREKFRQIIVEVIRKYEPRFKSVEVRMLDNSELLDRTLRFRIDALLKVEPAPEPVTFDTRLEPSTCTFEIKGTNVDR